MILPRETASRRAFAHLWLAAATLVAVLLAAASAPATAGARPLITGITNLGNNEPLAFERTKAAGATYVRIRLDWEQTAPKSQPGSWHPDDPTDPHYDWRDSDDEVVRATAAGLIPVLQVDAAPRWAQRCTTPGVIPDAVCDPAPAALAAFGTAAARRYSGGFGALPRVQYWQPLNEPNLSLFFFPQFRDDGKPLSPGLYRNLVNAFYASVKAVDPSNLVVAAGLGPTAIPKWTIGPMRFARELLCMKGHNRPQPRRGKCGGGVRFDIFAIQPYTTGGPSHEGGINDVQLGDLAKLRTLLAAADRANRIKGKFRRTPLWITEFSWDSQPPDPGGLPMPIVTRWAAEALYRAWVAGVTRFFWYSLRDGTPQPKKPFDQTLESGLYFRGDSIEADRPKEVLSAFRFPFVAFPRKRGLFFWGRTPESTPGRVAIQVWKGNRWRNVVLSRASKAGIFTGIAPSRYGRDEKGMVRALYQGQSPVPFSMTPVADFKHPPFGSHRGTRGEITVSPDPPTYTPAGPDPPIYTPAG